MDIDDTKADDGTQERDIKNQLSSSRRICWQAIKTDDIRQHIGKQDSKV